ncbi:MAG TPA: hypothetical protein VNI84_21090 [Pyrinomonadaceae bacterium]|nr:hypothetical protein [Pyrinomonadaceae bacterium]
MPKHTFTENITVGNNTYFAGDAEISEIDAQALKQSGGSVPETSAKSAFPEDYPGFDVLGQVEGMTPEKLKMMSDDEITAINGIGPATLKQIRAIK